MADKNNINKSVSSFNPSYLASSSVRESVQALKNKIKLISEKNKDLNLKSQLSSLNRRLDSINDNYKYLLDYMMKGLVDDNRRDMINDMHFQLLQINDGIDRALTLIDSPAPYYSIKRYENVRGATIDERIKDYEEANSKLPEISDPAYLELKIKEEEALVNLFNHVWTMFGEGASEYRKIYDLIFRHPDNFDLQAQIISALLLANIEYFDINSVKLLIDIYETELSTRISARALTAIYLISSLYPDRLPLDSFLSKKLEGWEDSVFVYTQLRDIIMDVIKTIETRRISEKVENELMPELLKHRGEIIDNLNKSNSDSGFESADIHPDEFNPAWEEMIEKSGLGEKLRELTELQLEGGDFMMTTFKNLKDFPFFKTEANWFLPFSFSNSNFSGANSQISKDLQTLFEIDGVICDSDKFSFALSLSRMPEQQRKMLSSQMKAQMEQLREALEEKKKHHADPGFASEASIYIRDLYRFFNLYRKKEYFKNPLEKGRPFHEIPFIKDIVNELETLNLVAEFYFKKGYYKEAIPVFLLIDEKEESDYITWEKIGYSYFKLRRYDKALQWFRKADLFNPDSKWLSKHLAHSLKATHNYTEAYEAYKKVASSEPENLNAIINMGVCKIKEDKPEEALPHFYHADYLSPENKDIWRWLAWTEMLSCHLDKSQKYYQKISESGEAHSEDFLNMAYLSYFLDDFKGAVENFKRFLSLEHGKSSALWENIDRDLEILQGKGMKKDDIYLLADRALYDFFNN